MRRLVVQAIRRPVYSLRLLLYHAHELMHPDEPWISMQISTELVPESSGEAGEAQPGSHYD
jgi:hypothetical protein